MQIDSEKPDLTRAIENSRKQLLALGAAIEVDLKQTQEMKRHLARSQADADFYRRALRAVVGYVTDHAGEVSAEALVLGMPQEFSSLMFHVKREVDLSAVSAT